VGFIAPWRFESSLRHQHPMPCNGTECPPVPSRRVSPHRRRRLSSVSGRWQGSAPTCTERNPDPDAWCGRGSGHPEGTPGTPRRPSHKSRIMNLLCCQGAGGLWTGLGWVTPVGGQALIRSHGPPRRRRVGSTGHYQDNAGEHVSRFVGSDPTHDFQIMWGRCL